jgi:hypothetical protein
MSRVRAFSSSAPLCVHLPIQSSETRRERDAEMLTSIVDVSELKETQKQFETSRRELEIRMSEREGLLASVQTARRKLAQANRNQDEFVATLSHESRLFFQRMVTLQGFR